MTAVADAGYVSLNGIEWEEKQPQWWIAKRDGYAVAAFRFETVEINQKRYERDKPQHPVGLWGSCVKTESGSQHLTWPKDTPIAEMKRAVEAADIRLR